MSGRIAELAGMLKGRPRAVAGGLALALAVGAGGLLAARPQPTPAEASLTAARLPVVLPVREAPEPPEALQARLEALARAYGEDVGIAVADVDAGWTAGVDVEGFYPQQSVSKLWVAMAVLKAVDEGRLELGKWVTMTDADRSVFFQPVTGNIGPGGYRIQISALLRRAIVESDNAANDRLIREVGGPDSVGFALAELGLEGVSVGAYERDLQAMVAGLPWRPEYGHGWNFQHARERLPLRVRQEALDAYLLNPLDGAQPAAVVRALSELKRGYLLSEESTGYLLDLLDEVRTGPRRLKGGLPPGWRIGHKTGTGQDFRGASVGINDVGLLTAPDGKTYAVAVMMRRTWKSVPERLALMQAVSRAVVAEWERGRREPLLPNLEVAVFGAEQADD